MTLRIVVFLFLVALIAWGLRTILRDWRNAFIAGDKAAQERHKARLDRNRAEARTQEVVELQKGEDGIYRPRQRDRDGA